jgi:hypothetical protein
MPSSDVQIPPQVENLVTPILWLLFGAAVIWLLLAFLRHLRRRAYNLTKAESGGHTITPDFLKVDQKKRAEAIARGETFDQAHPQPVAPGADTVADVSRAIVFGAAILSFCGAATGALLSIEQYQQAYDRLGSWDRFVTIIFAHRIGFAFALLVILFNAVPLVSLVIKHRKKRASV